MRIGIIVEGEGEPPAFKKLLPKIATPNDFIQSPLRADLQPKALNMRVIARSAKSAVLKFQRERVDRIVVLIDREDHPCAPRFARELCIAFQQMYGMPEFWVVVKDWSIENWLIADPAALKKLTGRFQLPKNFDATVRGRADACLHPARMLSDACLRTDYRKGSDPTKIMAEQEPRKIAANSRSFRRFLRSVGEVSYAEQSKRVAR